MVRKLIRVKNGKTNRFIVEYDEYNVVDTIMRDGTVIVSTCADARVILNNADALASGFLSDRMMKAGFAFDKGR